MRPNGGGLRAVPVLVAFIAVLLPAGAFAAATVAPHRQAAPAGRVGATGFAHEVLVEDGPVAEVKATAAPATVAPPRTATVPPPSTTPPRSTATTAPPLPAPVPRTRATLAPPLPGAPVFPVTAKPEPSASQWYKTADGITLRMHIEPSTPVAGQPVTFVIDEVTAPVTCCILHLLPEFGTPTVPIQGSHGPNPEIGICGSPPATRTGLAHTHTYAEPGVYAVGLMVITSACQMPAVGGPSVAPTNRLLHLLACITVGPETVARSQPVPDACAGA